jgi:hypothetical protein
MSFMALPIAPPISAPAVAPASPPSTPPSILPTIVPTAGATRVPAAAQDPANSSPNSCARGPQAPRIDKPGRIVRDVSVEIYSASELNGIFRSEPAGRGIVVSGAVKIESVSGSSSRAVYSNRFAIEPVEAVTLPIRREEWRRRHPKRARLRVTCNVCAASLKMQSTKLNRSIQSGSNSKSLEKLPT